MTLDEARQLLREYRYLGFNYGPSMAIADLAEDTPVSEQRLREAIPVIEGMVGNGVAPVEILEAFRMVGEDVVRRYNGAKAALREEIAVHGAAAVWGAVDEAGMMNGVVGHALFDLDDEEEAALLKAAPAGTIMRTAPRARTPRARSRSRPPRAGDDDDLADLRRRCPRCGGALRPLLPSPHWTCDPCADRLWELMVAHAAAEVLAEAESITRDGAA